VCEDGREDLEGVGGVAAAPAGEMGGAEFGVGMGEVGDSMEVLG
jgi:hypothetical protein